jgi:transcriptional regulator with XRE-family HTH domain
MGTRERPVDRGRSRARQALLRIGIEHRQARVSGGLSLREASTASGTSYSRLWRFERGLVDHVSIPELGAWLAVVGLELALRAFPAGDPIRDRAQLALLERLRVRLNPALRWRTEVPLGVEGDLRAWDAEILGAMPIRWRARVEAETRIADGQALERRLNLKARDDPAGHVVLLVSDTRANRAALRAIREGMREPYPLDTRAILMARADGRDPGQSGIVVL